MELTKKGQQSQNQFAQFIRWSCHRIRVTLNDQHFRELEVSTSFAQHLKIYRQNNSRFIYSKADNTFIKIIILNTNRGKEQKKIGFGRKIIRGQPENGKKRRIKIRKDVYQ